jgi:hypothetical protein
MKCALAHRKGLTWCRSNVPVGLAPNWQAKARKSGGVAKEEQVPSRTEKLGGLQDDDAVGTRPAKGKGREVQVSIALLKESQFTHMHA